MKDVNRKMIVWFLLQIFLPLFFVLLTFLMQYEVDEFGFHEFCRSQRLLLISVMIFLNMAVVLISNNEYNEPEVSSESRYFIIWVITGFITFFGAYTLLLAREDMFTIDMYEYSSLGVYLIGLLWAFFLKLKIEKRIIQLRP